MNERIRTFITERFPKKAKLFYQKIFKLWVLESDVFVGREVNIEEAF